MVDTDYGAGIELTQDLDLRIDSTGDISSVDGVDELEKDLAFQLIRVFTDEVVDCYHRRISPVRGG